jgi:toxin ParE1/3/4
MTPFRLTKKAVEDLRVIGRYTEQHLGKEQRNIYLTRLDQGFQAIAREPEIGPACDDIRKGCRKLHVGRHLIFYAFKEQQILIVRILHERMDVESRFREGR